ncbi:MAG: hypothetical protein ACR2RV_23055 [Verrucomicrobiales bacterium]
MSSSSTLVFLPRDRGLTLRDTEVVGAIDGVAGDLAGDHGTAASDLPGDLGRSVSVVD